MAKIKYNGPKNVKRVIGTYVWSKDNNHAVDVADEDMVKTLLEQPDGEFTLVVDEKSATKKAKGEQV